MDKDTQVLTEVVKNTDSGIILAMVVIAVFLIVVTIPFYKMMINYDREKRKSHAQREGQLIEVVQHNTSIMSELKVILVNNSSTQTQTQMEYNKRLDDIEEAIVEHNEKLVEVHTLLKTRTCLHIDGEKQKHKRTYE